MKSKTNFRMNSNEEREHHHPPPSIEEQWSKMVQESKLTFGETNQDSRPKIQYVPRYLYQTEELQRYYLPRLISFGLFEPSNMGWPYKYKWAVKYLEQTNQTFVDVYHRISIYFVKLRNLYSAALLDRDVVPDNEFGVLGMVLNACSVLLVLEISDRPVYEQEQELKISIDNLVKVHQDMLLLRHQIPFKLLELVCNDKVRLNKCLHNFLKVHDVKLPRLKREENGATENKVIVDMDMAEDNEPVHLLDYLRTKLLMRDLGEIDKEIEVDKGSLRLRKYRIGTISELKIAGIHVKKDPNMRNNFKPSFNDGKLLIPQLTLDGSTRLIFFNLIAYEMCPDFRNDFGISSFVVFMNSLIDRPEDVKELRSAGILVNYLGSDKEVADLFNMMDKVLIRPEMAKFGYIRDQIQEYLESKRGKIKMLAWMGEAHNKYFRSPWTIIALLAASLALVLTFIQTWFAIYPKGS